MEGKKESEEEGERKNDRGKRGRGKREDFSLPPQVIMNNFVDGGDSAL